MKSLLQAVPGAHCGSLSPSELLVLPHHESSLESLFAAVRGTENPIWVLNICDLKKEKANRH